MTTETLRELIKIEFERFESIHELKESIFRVLDLYEKELNTKTLTTEKNDTRSTT